jgi:hypothetical protein
MMATVARDSGEFSCPTYKEISKSWDLNLPKISIVSATYNQRPYLERLLSGFVLQETVFPFEIVIRDDGSEDGSQDFLLAFQRKLPEVVRLDLLPQNTWTYLRPIQELLERAEGDFVAPCDGDDYWIGHEKLQNQADFLVTNPDVGLVHHPAQLISANGNSPAVGTRQQRAVRVPKHKPVTAIWSTAMFRKTEIPRIEVPIFTVGSGDFITLNLVTAHSSSHFMAGAIWAVKRNVAKETDSSGVFKSLASRIVAAQLLKQMSNSRRAISLTVESFSRILDISGLNYMEAQRATRFALWSRRKRLVLHLFHRLWPGLSRKNLKKSDSRERL